MAVVAAHGFASPPFLIRLLAWLTTSPWRDDPPLTGAVARRLAMLASEGWMIRQASPRNFVIWRSETLKGQPRRLLVLPNREVRLRTLERSAVAAGLIAHALPQPHAVTNQPEERTRADALADELGFPGGIVELSVHLASAERKIQAALAPSWAHFMHDHQ